MIALPTLMDINKKLAVRRRELNLFVKNLRPVFADPVHIETLDLLKRLKKAGSKDDKLRLIENILRINKV